VSGATSRRFSEPAPSASSLERDEMTEIIAIIWSRVEPLRQERGLSVERLAFICGVTASTLSDTGRGLKNELLLSTVLKLCSGLGVSSDVLLNDLPLPAPRRPAWVRQKPRG
jgi:transcriptional regulator with XRE-family HTH domain